MPVLLNALARKWRAFFLPAALAGAVTWVAPAMGAGGTPYLQLGQPDQAEGQRALAEFRRTGIAGEYFLEFELRVMPRRGDERVFHGRLWGGRNAQGAILRVAVTDASGHERRLLIQNGENAAVWRSDSATDPARQVEALAPLVDGVELTAFELQMPYIYWPNAFLENVSRVRGRPAHVFYFRPPAAWKAEHPEISAVRASLDTQFHAPVQSELIDRTGRVLRTLSLVDLKKVGEQYIVKSIDLRNDVTRDKTRFQVTAAALDLEFAGAVFEPAHLNEDVTSPPASRLTRIAP
jgi:hypothetical protein